MVIHVYHHFLRAPTVISSKATLEDNIAFSSGLTVIEESTYQFPLEIAGEHDPVGFLTVPVICRC